MTLSLMDIRVLDSRWKRAGLRVVGATWQNINKQSYVSGLFDPV